jgi:excinuclease UvrABC nuclease subunit
MNNSRTALYRHYNVSAELLYVGVSVSTMKRLAQHQHSPWVHDITRIEIQYFENRQDALNAEKRAIKTEKPLFNKRHKPRPLSVVEEIYNRVSNATDEDKDLSVGFANIEVAFDFLEEYWKHAQRMKRLNAKANAHPAQPSLA